MVICRGSRAQSVGESMTPKQERFVEEYLSDLNATQAAIRAGYSEKTAYEIGHQNLKKVEVQAALQTAFAARSERVQIDQDWVLRRLAAIASIDVRKLFAADGTLRPIHELPEEVAGAISSVEIVKRRAGDEDGPEYLHRVRSWDKVKALELLGKHLRMFSDRVEVAGKGTHPVYSELTEDELIERLMAKRRARRGDDELAERWQAEQARPMARNGRQ